MTRSIRRMGLLLAVVMFFSTFSNILTCANAIMNDDESPFIGLPETTRTTTPSLITTTTANIIGIFKNNNILS